jgi:hypothetical protein
MRIFRENIEPFSVAIVANPNEVASNGEKGAKSRAGKLLKARGVVLEYIQGEGNFPR